MNFMRQRFGNVEEAEACYGLDVDSYLSDAPSGASQAGPTLRLDEVLISSLKSLTQHQLQELICEAIASLSDKKSVLLKVLANIQLSSAAWEEVIASLVQPLSDQEKMALLDREFVAVARTQGIDTNPADFCSISLGAMKTLQENGKPNLIHKWSKCVFGEDGKPLIPLHRMPFGVIQYQMEFFTCTNVMQVSCRILL